MTKIMLVEDDNNLREIYEARLAAEGYEIVSAEDGEAALAIAAKEKPSLVITDVMMPKISGFEMLDILRNTDALHDVKVIMLTALSQAEDNACAGKLGADRYLVKSQVTLEDIVKAAHELLDGAPADATSAADATTPKATDTAVPTAADPTTTTMPVAAPAVVPAPTSGPATDSAASTTPPVTAPTTDDTIAPAAAPSTDDSSSPAVDARSVVAEAEIANAQTLSQEESALNAQINQFLESAPAEAPIEVTPENTVTTPTQEPTASTEGATDAEAIAVPSAEPTEPIPSAEAPTASQQSEAAPAPAADITPTPDATTPLTPEPTAQQLTESVPEPSPTPQTEQLEQPAPAAPAAEQTGDQVVSSAIDSMMAQNPETTPEPVLPPSEAWKQQEKEQQADASVPIMGATGGSPEPDPSDLPAGVSRPITPDASPTPEPGAPSNAAQTTRAPKKIIQPLDQGSKPDIHQLLSMEEAKNGAVMAAQVTTASTPVAPPPAPAQPAAQPVATQPVPPTPVGGLDPNSVAM